MYPGYMNSVSYPQMNQYFSQNQYSTPQSLTRVTGIQGAKAYQMGANSTVALFDSNEDIMYIKTTDGAGFPTIRTFSFSEMFDENNTQTQNSDYVSKEEFDSFKQEVVDYVQQFISQQSSKSKQNITTNGISEELRKSGNSFQADVQDKS